MDTHGSSDGYDLYKGVFNYFEHSIVGELKS